MKNKKSYTPSKWGKLKEQYLEWWESLSTEEKVKAKEKFVLQSHSNENRIVKYPDMPNVKHLRLSQLSNAHLYRIWVFRDRDEYLS